MADAARDDNRVTVLLGMNDDGSTGPILADHVTGYILLSLYPGAAPIAIDTYNYDNNRVHPALLSDDIDAEALPWLANSSGGAWVSIA